MPKIAYVLDEDIDVYDDERVKWAIARRYDPGTGTLLLPGRNMPPLDPSLGADHPPSRIEPPAPGASPQGRPRRSRARPGRFGWPAGPAPDVHRPGRGARGHPTEKRQAIGDLRMFLFYFNKLGCLGSVLVSVALTAVLILAFRLLNG